MTQLVGGLVVDHTKTRYGALSYGLNLSLSYVCFVEIKKLAIRKAKLFFLFVNVMLNPKRF
jgi:hypothetical protein